MMNKHDEPKPNENTIDNEDYGARSSHSGGGFFEIHVKGHLGSEWSDWLEGMEVRLLDNGEMILFGTIVDQAALLGILNKVHRLNLTLLSVRAIDQTESH